MVTTSFNSFLVSSLVMQVSRYLANFLYEMTEKWFWGLRSHPYMYHCSRGCFSDFAILCISWYMYLKIHISLSHVSARTLRLPHLPPPPPPPPRGRTRTGFPATGGIPVPTGSRTTTLLEMVQHFVYCVCQWEHSCWSMVSRKYPRGTKLSESIISIINPVCILFFLYL